MELPGKDPQLVRLVDRLRADLDVGYFTLVDHWAGDRLAIGLARPDKPGVLVYVAVTPDSDDVFFECEIPGDPYEVARTEDHATYAQLLSAVTSHLRPTRL